LSTYPSLINLKPLKITYGECELIILSESIGEMLLSDKNENKSRRGEETKNE